MNPRIASGTRIRTATNRTTGCGPHNQARARSLHVGGGTGRAEPLSPRARRSRFSRAWRPTRWLLLFGARWLGWFVAALAAQRGRRHVPDLASLGRIVEQRLAPVGLFDLTGRRDRDPHAQEKDAADGRPGPIGGGHQIVVERAHHLPAVVVIEEQRAFEPTLLVVGADGKERANV